LRSPGGGKARGEDIAGGGVADGGEELAEFDEEFAAGAGVGVRREEFGGLEKGFDLEEGRFSACGFFDLLDEAKD